MASRGRGQRATQVLAEATKPSKAPPNVQELGKYLKKLGEANLSTYGTTFADMVREYVSDNSGKLQEAVNLIFDTTVESKENAVLGAKLCERIMTPTDKQAVEATAFRRAMLSRIQEKYQRRREIRAKSIEMWLGIFAFLCELFLRIKVQDKPVPVMGKAILSTSIWMLELSECDDDEVDCICVELKRIGSLLELVSPDQVRKVVSLLRERVITSKSTARVRCLALEVLEYCAMGWKDSKQQLHQFFIDALPDAVGEDETKDLG